MNLSELPRLIELFAAEAAKFHDIRFTRFFATQKKPRVNRKFASKNHAIPLWQFYGVVKAGAGFDQFVADVQASGNFGIRGAELSAFAVLEGEACKLFVRMAVRAGSLFDENEQQAMSVRLRDEIFSGRPAGSAGGKPVAIVNPNPLAVWLNYLLYHLSLTNPGRERATLIQPDVFSLSLTALERLAAEAAQGRRDPLTESLADMAFDVGLSFAGEKRPYVAAVVAALKAMPCPRAVFYDYDFQAQLARPNLDTYLQRIYHDRCRLVVVFFCADYERKDWCGLEWRAVRDLIKNRHDDRVMFVRFDDVELSGMFSIDGYIDARTQSPVEVAALIDARLRTLPR